MSIHQVLVGARAGDAITQMAVQLQGPLARFGDSQIFARHVDATKAHRVRHLPELAAQCRPGDIVILHVSIGDELVWDAVLGSGARVWVSYHNITPAELFADDPHFASMLTLGREQLQRHRDRIEHVVTESEFNRMDLESMGFHDVEVLPGLLDPFRLHGLPSDPHFGNQVHHRAPGPLLLFVGQILPHKRPDLLVAAHHLLTAHHRPDATLVLAGHHPVPRFAQQVSNYAASLGLSHRVWLTGGIDDARLAELYRRADVFVTASRHEGLCLPVLEAFAMSVPVVVADHGALPETVEDCGIVVRNDSPPDFAEAMLMALDPDVHHRYVTAGRRRARERSLVRAQEAAVACYEKWI